MKLHSFQSRALLVPALFFLISLNTQAKIQLRNQQSQSERETFEFSGPVDHRDSSVRFREYENGRYLRRSSWNVGIGTRASFFSADSFSETFPLYAISLVVEREFHLAQDWNLLALGEFSYGMAPSIRRSALEEGQLDFLSFIPSLLLAYNIETTWGLLRPILGGGFGSASLKWIPEDPELERGDFQQGLAWQAQIGLESKWRNEFSLRFQIIYQTVSFSEFTIDTADTNKLDGEFISLSPSILIGYRFF